MNANTQLSIGTKIKWFLLGLVSALILLAILVPQFNKYGGSHFLGMF